jgi:hypothetical protein
MLLAQLARDARRRQLHELGKRRVWPAGSARQQRNEPGHHHIGMAVKPAQVDRLSAAAATPPLQPTPSTVGPSPIRSETLLP